MVNVRLLGVEGLSHDFYDDFMDLRYNLDTVKSIGAIYHFAYATCVLRAVEKIM